MKRVKRSSIWIVVSTTLLALGLLLNGCAQEPPMASAETGKVTRTADELTFLKSTTVRFEKQFNISQFVTVAEGDSVISGDDTSGYSMLVFNPGDLPMDTTIVFNWDSEGYISDFEPHGIYFASPVELVLSYKDADLTGVDEDSLQIWYYDEVYDVWELVGGVVNKQEKRVEGFIHHFSRYGIASN